MDIRIFLVALSVGAASGATVTGASPYWLGMGGGTTIYVYGSGFSEDQFSHFDPNLGNRVTLVNEADSVECNVVQYLSNTEKIVCSIEKRINSAAPTVYALKVFVDGEEAVGTKTVQFHGHYSPIVEYIEPRWSLPGETEVSFRGYFHTDRYKVADASADPLEDDLDSGRVLTKVYLGFVDCDMINATTGEVYEGFDDRDLTCMPKTKNVGPMNGTVYVTERGASVTRNYGMRVDSQDKLYQHHTYGAVNSVSPSTGSLGGKTLITVTGIGFNPSPGATEVLVGGAECEIQSITDDDLTCLTPAESETSAGPRERGFLFEMWDGIAVDISKDEEMATLDPSDASYFSESYQDMSFDIEVTSGNTSTGRVTGYLNVAHDGEYSLGIHAVSSWVILLVANDSNPDNLVQVNHWEVFNMYKGIPCYFEFRWRGADSTLFKVYMKDFSTPFLNSQSSMIGIEKHRVRIRPQIKNEMQRITTSGSPVASKLYLGGFLSNAVDLSDAEQVRSAILGLVDQQCEVIGTNPSFSRRTSYEVDEETPEGDRGSTINDVEPFCGRRVYKAHETDPKLFSQNDLNLMVNVFDFPYMCMALRGNAVPSMRIHIYWWDIWNRWRSDDVWFDHDFTSDENTWSYKCVDIIDAVHKSWIQRYRNNGTFLFVRRAYAPLRASDFDDVYVDEFSFSSENIDIAQSRPSALNNAGILIDDITVNSVEIDNVTSLEVDFVTSNCAGSFPLLGVTDGAANPSWSTTLNSAATSQTFAVSGGSVVVDRVEAGTNMVGGTWSLTILGKTLSGLSPRIHEQVLEEMVSGALGSTGMQVEDSGSCKDRRWEIWWNTEPGRKELSTVDDSMLTFDGDSINVECTRSGEARVWYDPIIADFVTMRRTEPHVSVRINGYSAACLGDCSYGFDSSGVPTVSSVAGSVDSSGVHTLTITGSDFTSSDLSDYSVLVGDSDCTVTARTTSTITCTIDELPAGSYDVVVVMQPVGAATASTRTTTTYTVSLAITSISPTSGGTGGGYSVTVYGTGFPFSEYEWMGNSITIDGSECEVYEANSGSATCMVPAGSAGSVDVSVTVSGETATLSGGFTYDASQSALITTVSPTTSSALGGDELSIVGAGFGDGTDGYVMVGDNDCPVSSWDDAWIKCTLPVNNPGVQDVKVYTGSDGFASGSKSVTYTFKVTGASSATGSVYGGTLMVINGEGFGTDCSLLSVELGDSMFCDVTECSDTQLTCITRLVSTNHEVTNMGILSGRGKGFAWDPKTITIREGDQITWKWSKVDEFTQVLYNVFQTSSASDKSYDGSGFNSGSPIAAGSITVDFPHMGTYFYAGDPVVDDFVMTGQINVIRPSEDVYRIAVKLGEIEAEYVPSGSNPSVSVTGCSPLLGAFADCSSTAPSAPDSDNLYFITNLCYTPTVTAISADSTENIAGLLGIQVRSGATLTITGTGFGTDMCQTSVSVGSASCLVSASSDTSVTCILSDYDNIYSIKALPVVVTTANRGSACVDIENYKDNGQVTFVPVITSFSPTEGSIMGGTSVTVSGTGLNAFDSMAYIPLGSGPCEISSVTATEIICSTAATSASSVPVVVYISVYNILAISDLTVTSYAFSDSATPSVTSVSVSGETFTVTGSSFGTDTSGVEIKLMVSTTRHERSIHDELNESVKEEENIIEEEEEDEDMYAYYEDEPEARSTRRPKINSDLFDKFDKVSSFWGTFTNTKAKTFEETLRLGAWRIAGSNAYVPQDTTNTEEIETRDTRDADPTTYDCTVSAVSDTSIVCSVSSLPANSYTVYVNVLSMGLADEPTTVSVSPTVSSISPTSGSTNGGALLTISGTGFTTGDVTVDIDGSDCPLESESANTLTCRVPAHAAGSATVTVTTNSLSASASDEFSYSAANTPVLSSVAPDTGVSNGNSLVLTGTEFMLSGEDPTVMIGGVDCPVTSASSTSVTCTSPDLAGGSHTIFVRDSMYGDSNSDLTVTYDFTVSTSSPMESGTGGTAIIITGFGFDPNGNSAVTVCDNPCSISSYSSSSIDCVVPPYTGSDATVMCDIVVTNPDSSTATKTDGFTYKASLTPSVTSVSPKRGGTAGGTVLTITGSGFASSGNIVTIDGSSCIVSAESTSEITCETEPHAGPGEYPVLVESPGLGYATTDENGVFFYIDRWSSIFTWGGNPVPSDGEYIVIKNGQTILLDESTGVLKALIIQGGHLVFDDEASEEIVLRAEYILIVDEGSLSIGSEEEPFMNDAVIELHGNTRSIELPMYGAKVLAVRNGTLDVHGAPIDVTWTKLASTASTGATSVTLITPVPWKAGDEVVIATTEHRFGANENEQRTIASVSGDGLTLTFTEALDYEHIAIEQTLGGRLIETRAEIGLLTRNVKIRGNVNADFTTVIEACDETWTPDQFDTQSCFNGRFGEEIGSDQFGATVMIFGKYPNQDLVHGRIEYTEVTHAGQAFQLGRYPLHFHLVGNVNSSYVKGCAIHHTFNRAVTIHAADYLTIQRNVAYNNMGHAFFTEDGNEQYNVIEYNLAIFTRSSSSLLNVDITPASYWVVHPNNVVRHNAAAGGTHFGYWYRLERHPTGPSATDSICQNNAKMGEFYNNTAHSMGRYGLWVFSMDGYFPKVGECGGSDLVAKWNDFTVWKCDRGAEVVFGGALQFHNFVALDNENAGLEMVKMEGEFGEDDGPGIFDSLVIGHSDLSDGTCMASGIIAPKQYIFNIKDTKFVNFDLGTCAALSGCAQCKLRQGGFRTQVSGLSFENSPNKLKFQWEHEGIWIDNDGSLTGTAENTVVPSMGILPPDSCDIDASEFSVNPEVPGSVCTGLKFLRFNVEGRSIEPDSLQGRDIIVSNSHGNTSVPYRIKRLTSEGWMGILFTEDTYNWKFDESEQLTNISYKAETRFLDNGDYYFVEQDFIQKPDSFGTLGEQKNSTDALPDPDVNFHGDYYWNNDTYQMTYLVSEMRNRRKRDTFEDRSTGTKRTIEFEVFRCYFTDCIQPTPPPVPTGRPDETFRWSDTESWKEVPVGSGGHPTEDTYGLPVEGDEIIIPQGMWLIVDTATPKLGRVYVYGAIEFEDVMDHTFEATIIYLQGGSVVAGFSEDAPFEHNLNIVLRGSLDMTDPDNTDMPMPFGVPNVGWKAIGVFGQLTLHGKYSGKSWVKIGATASAGDTTVTLAETADSSWVNKEVMITTTSKEVMETEIKTVTSVSGSVLTLDSALEYDHLGETFTLSDSSESFLMAGEVALLSRNIRIEGNDYEDLQEEGLGGRIVVSQLNSEGVDYVGQVQLSNVELKNMGQEGFTDFDDPRYSLAFVGLGINDGSNYVKKCTFNKNYNTAIGLFGTENVTIDDSVIYHTVGPCILDDSADNVFRGNLLSVMLFPGTYNGRFDDQNLDWFGAFALNSARRPVLENNVVAGSEQAGYQTFGESCDDATLWDNNEVHSAIYGVMIWRKGAAPDSLTCRRVDNVYAWRVWDTAFYMQHFADYLLENVKAVDCNVGTLQIIYAPPSLTHKFLDKKATIKDSIFVGASDNHNCEYQNSEPNVQEFMSKFIWKGGAHLGYTGIVFASFVSGPNMAPKHAFADADSYPALHGSTHIRDVTFANYDSRDCGRDVALFTNPIADDGVHPIFTSGLTFVDTPTDSYISMHEPNLGPVNPSDCVDMTCDGHKKVIITDEDGTLLGSVNATATSQAEYEWDGDARHGVGDYRIPVSLKMNTNGSAILAADKFPNKGIVRDNTCTLQTTWRAWKCTGLRHRMMIIESMDSDTEIRRLSPIALIADPGTSGYVDLINGPMDRGWCFGYTCQERISTFLSIVASGYTYEMAMTSTPPQVLRFHLLNSNPSETVLLRIFFPKTQRYDIYVDNVFVKPTNIDESASSYQLVPPDPANPEAFFPTHSDPAGSNYLQRDEKFLHVLLRGGHITEIKTTPTVLLSTGLVIDPDNFFEQDVVNNIAALLGVDPANIRVTNVIRETSGRKRRAATENIVMEFNIASSPTTSLESGSSATDGEILSYDDLTEKVSNLVNDFQAGCSDCNLTISSVVIEDPVPPPEEPGEPATEEFGAVVVDGGDLFSNKQQEINAQALNESLEAKVYEEPSGATLVQGVPMRVDTFDRFDLQPQISVQTSDGSNLESLGYIDNPWMIEAVLSGGSSDTILEGTNPVPYGNGMANFTDLWVNKPGMGYTMTFKVKYPEDAPNLDVPLAYSFKAVQKKVALVFTDQTRSMGNTMYVNADSEFSLPLALVDDETGMPMDPTLLNGQALTGTIKSTNNKKGKLLGPTSFTFMDGDISQFSLDGLKIKKPGTNYKVFVKAQVEPAGWTLRVKSEGFKVLPEDLIIPDDAVTWKVSMKGMWGKAKNVDVEMFGKKLINEITKKVGLALWEVDDIRAGNKVLSILKATGSESQLDNAVAALCTQLKKRKITVKINRQKFVMSLLKVNGDRRKWCDGH